METAIQLYLNTDNNGGGQQDFLRQKLLIGLRLALRDSHSQLHGAVIASTDLPQAMLRSLKHPPKKALAREHICLLHAEITQASARSEAISRMLADRREAWQTLGAVVAGKLTGEACPSPPAKSSPSPSLPSPEVAAPAQLLELDDDAGDDELIDAKSRSSRLCESIPSPPSLDAENIDPNSPPAAKRGRSPEQDKPAVDMAPMSPRVVVMASLTAPCTPPSAKDDAHPGTPRPNIDARVGTPRPEEGGHEASDYVLNYVESGSLRTSNDFSRDTPQPKVIRRAYLHRRAKESSPFLPPTPTEELASPRLSSAPDLQFGEDTGHVTLEDVEAVPEDPAVAQLRTSVRTLCF